MTENNSHLIDHLNDEQRQAVLHDEGPLLIVAGAGTGKTTVLINRLAYLALEKKVNPEQILLLTFTEKAASEMEERADQAMPYGYVDLWIKTFHSFCETVLRDYGLEIGLNSDFRLLTQTEQWILIKKNLSLFNLNYYSPLGNPDKFISELIKHFSRLKDEDISPTDYLKFAKDNHSNITAETEKLDVEKITELAGAYEVYNKLLLDNKYLDFGDLILYTLKLFKQRPNILSHYRRKFKYVMVDEFQDTNWSQYELLKLLIDEKHNLVAVGDDDQAIYKFRGASIANIMQFKEDFPHAKQIILKRNYRSAQIILDKSYSLVKHNNPNRLEDKLQIDKSLIGREDLAGVVKELVYATDMDELTGTAEMIKQLQATGNINWSDIAVLARSNSVAEGFAQELARQGIPSQFVSMKGLYQKPIVLDILAYLKLLIDNHDSASLFRVLGVPVFGLEQLEIVKLNRFARTKLFTLYEGLSNVKIIPELAKDVIDKVKIFRETLGKHSQAMTKLSSAKLYLQVVSDCFLSQLNYDIDQDKIAYLNQLYLKIIGYEKIDPSLNLKAILELIELEQMSGDTGSIKINWEDADVVKVMTVHASKGLEFDQVFVVNVVDKRFPTIGISDKIPVPDALVKEKLPSGDYHLQEERRLFYVAMTRAKRGLYLTRAKDYGGKQAKKGSRFLIEAEISDSLELGAMASSQMEKDLALDSQPIIAKTTMTLPDKFSFSQLEAFNNCPWQYRFAFILKIPTPEKPVMVFGRLMHNCLKDYFSASTKDDSQPELFDQKSTADYSWERLQKIFTERWSDYGYDDREQADKYKANGLRILKQIAETTDANNAPKVLSLEKGFTLKIKDYWIKGAIDRMDILPDGTVEIIDYKTGTPKTKVDFQVKRQLLIYQLAVEATLGLKVSQLTFHYLDDNSKLSFTAKDSDLEKIQAWVVETIETMQDSDFKAQPSILCGYCDFKNICEFKK